MDILKNRTCCFTGHRDIEPERYDCINECLKETIIKLIKKGVRYFGTGGALGFDTMAALTLLDLKKEYPHIKLILVLPCITQTNHWQQKDIDIYEDIKSKCDKYVYTSENYSKGCMFKRNRHLADNSGYCICYLIKNSGGTAYTVNYARNKGLKIFNISDYLI